MGYRSKANLHRAIETFCGLTLLLILVASSCARRSPPPEKNSNAARRNLECAPRTEPAGKLSLAVRSIEVVENKTVVRLVAYSTSEPLDFHLPVYLMSRGRWLINDQARAISSG